MCLQDFLFPGGRGTSDCKRDDGPPDPIFPRLCHERLYILFSFLYMSPDVVIYHIFIAIKKKYHIPGFPLLHLFSTFFPAIGRPKFSLLKTAWAISSQFSWLKTRIFLDKLLTFLSLIIIIPLLRLCYTLREWLFFISST